MSGNLRPARVLGRSFYTAGRPECLMSSGYKYRTTVCGFLAAIWLPAATLCLRRCLAVLQPTRAPLLQSVRVYALHWILLPVCLAFGMEWHAHATAMPCPIISTS